MMTPLRVAFAAVMSALFVLLVAGPAAATDPNYPPTPGPTTSVEGVKSGINTDAPLPHTGFDPSFLVWAVALVLVGFAVVVLARRRPGSH